MTDMQTPASEQANDGRLYWRSLEQLADSERYQEVVHNEFAPGASEPPSADDVSRRGFLGILASAVALAGATGCRKPYRKILPFAKRPEDMVPGVPDHYATSLLSDGYANGVVVRTFDGRPLKVEGNKLHPSNLGAANAHHLGEILSVYDPARSQGVAMRPAGVAREGALADVIGEGDSAAPATMADFDAFWNRHKGSLGDGSKLAVLMPPTTSPTLLSCLEEATGTFSKMTVHTWAPLSRHNEVAGAQVAFGKPLDAQIDFTAAQRVVAFDADFLAEGPMAMRYARDFASTRRPYDTEDPQMSRLYVAESSMTVTGGQADHRLRIKPSEIAKAVFALAAELGVADAKYKSAEFKSPASTDADGKQKGGKNWIAAVAKDLENANGQGVVLAGPRQPAAVHAAVAAINSVLGNVGKTVTYTNTATQMASDPVASLKALSDRIDRGEIDTLIILGDCNPAYDAPVDLDFASKLAKVPNAIHCGLWRDETAQRCTWHLNRAHDFESWADGRAYDGTISVVQPLIAPLFGGLSDIELCAKLFDLDEKEGYKLVRYYWEDNADTDNFGTWWSTTLHDGLAKDTALPAVATPNVNAGLVAQAISQQASASANSGFEVIFEQSPAMKDGRYANNSWLAECPDPITKLTWDNAAMMSMATAKELGVWNDDLIQVELRGKSLKLPVWIKPGQADNTISLPLGWGRNPGEAFRVAGGGFDVYPLRASTGMGVATGAKVSKTTGSYKLVSTQDHGAMEGRPIVREATLDEYKADPDFAPMESPLAKAAEIHNKVHGDGHGEGDHKHAEGEGDHSHGETEQSLLDKGQLWEGREYDSQYQWGMVIDLNTCNGCNACVVACQSENNIPAVGKTQVAQGREMQWLRVDRYFTAGEDADGDGIVNEADPTLLVQPIPCMHCENAPCEAVCPVAATIHSPEGLNDMAYNRCVGTRYCSNNCPYKVRRFNYFNFIGELDPTLKMVQNPDVTIRARGVMEKCTYCTQRITAGKRQAKLEDRVVRDGEIVPACGQACPSNAITFGNIADPKSRVSQLRRKDLNYALLSELNVRPRTTYLARVRNPNPELV